MLVIKFFISGETRIFRKYYCCKRNTILYLIITHYLTHSNVSLSHQVFISFARHFLLYVFWAESGKSLSISGKLRSTPDQPISVGVALLLIVLAKLNSWYEMLLILWPLYYNCIIEYLDYLNPSSHIILGIYCWKDLSAIFINNIDI